MQPACPAREPPGQCPDAGSDLRWPRHREQRQDHARITDGHIERRGAPVEGRLGGTRHQPRAGGGQVDIVEEPTRLDRCPRDAGRTVEQAEGTRRQRLGRRQQGGAEGGPRGVPERRIPAERGGGREEQADPSAAAVQVATGVHDRGLELIAVRRERDRSMPGQPAGHFDGARREGCRRSQARHR